MRMLQDLIKSKKYLGDDMYKILIGIFACLIATNAEPLSYSTEQGCLAYNIYFEARGESTAGQVAVGQVTLNRVNSDKFPNSVCGVVRDAVVRDGKIVKCQFSWYCDGIPEVIRNPELYNKTYELAEYLLSSDMPDITDGALFFHSKSVNPGWKRKKLVTIGNHIFYA